MKLYEGYEVIRGCTRGIGNVFFNNYTGIQC